jgi:hypothetical protein
VVTCKQSKELVGMVSLKGQQSGPFEICDMVSDKAVGEVCVNFMRTLPTASSDITTLSDPSLHATTPMTASVRAEESELDIDPVKEISYDDETHISLSAGTSLSPGGFRAEPMMNTVPIEEVGLDESVLSIDSLLDSDVALRRSLNDNPLLNLNDTRISFPSLHVIDIKIVNCLTVNKNIVERIDDMLGAYVKYTFDDQTPLVSEDDAVNVMTHRFFSLWWDEECLILNGRMQHRFSFRRAKDLSNFTSKGWLLEVNVGDPEMPEAKGSSVGAAYIDPATLTRLFGAQEARTLSLPVMSLMGTHICQLELEMLHHIEPSLLKSTEFRSSLLPLHSSSIQGQQLCRGHGAAIVVIDRCVNLTSTIEQPDSTTIHCECQWTSSLVDL